MTESDIARLESERLRRAPQAGRDGAWHELIGTLYRLMRDADPRLPAPPHDTEGTKRNVLQNPHQSA